MPKEWIVTRIDVKLDLGMVVPPFSDVSLLVYNPQEYFLVIRCNKYLINHSEIGPKDLCSPTERVHELGHHLVGIVASQLHSAKEHTLSTFALHKMWAWPWHVVDVYMGSVPDIPRVESLEDSPHSHLKRRSGCTDPHHSRNLGCWIHPCNRNM